MISEYRGNTMNKERLVSIDSIRGIAILGIYLVNMMSFHSPILYLDPLSQWSNLGDRLTYMFIDIFAQGSFYPLFALLFGYSFVLLRNKTLRQQMPFTRTAVRRLLFLLVIGIFHTVFIWHGDILISYAFLGFILLFFLKLPGRSLLFGGISLYVIPVLLLITLLIITTMIEPMSGQVFTNQAAIQQSLHSYQQGTFLEITKQRLLDWSTINNFKNIPFLLVSILPLFLIGAGIAKLKWLENPQQFQSKLSYLLFSTFFLGILLKSFPYFFGNSLASEYIQGSVGGVSLAIFYATLVIKCSTINKFEKWLTPFAIIGRMSISNYLFQSIVSTLIFYHFGLGLYGEVSLLQGSLLVLGIYFVQIKLSKIWLNRFNYGPVETLWRYVTYGRHTAAKANKL